MTFSTDFVFCSFFHVTAGDSQEDPQVEEERSVRSSSSSSSSRGRGRAAVGVAVLVGGGTLLLLSTAAAALLYTYLTLHIFHYKQIGIVYVHINPLVCVFYQRL